MDDAKTLLLIGVIIVTILIGLILGKRPLITVVYEVRKSGQYNKEGKTLLVVFVLCLALLMLFDSAIKEHKLVQLKHDYDKEKEKLYWDIQNRIDQELKPYKENLESAESLLSIYRTSLIDDMSNDKASEIIRQLEISYKMAFTLYCEKEVKVRQKYDKKLDELYRKMDAKYEDDIKIVEQGNEYYNLIEWGINLLS